MCILVEFVNFGFDAPSCRRDAKVFGDDCMLIDGLNHKAVHNQNIAVIKHQG